LWLQRWGAVSTTVSPRTADEALREQGLDGRRLLKLAHRITQDAQRRAPAGLGGKYEDLHSFLVEQALRAALSYDPAISNGGYSFESYLCDVMEQRVPDFYRRKSEGFGDRRSGSDGRVVLGGSMLDDADPEVDFEKLISERRMARYQRAAAFRGWTVAEWIVITLDAGWRGAEREGA
jgi:hypothetical protein